MYIEEPLDTPLGRTYITLTDANHAYVHNGSNLNAPESAGYRGPLTVFGVEYTLGMHLHRWSDGEFHLGLESEDTYKQRQSMHGTKSWTHINGNNREMSEAARKKIIAVLIPLVNEWIKANPQQVHAAEAENLQTELERAISTLISTKRAYTRASDDVKDIQKRIDDLKLAEASKELLS